MTVSTYEPRPALPSIGDESFARWVTILEPAAALAQRISDTEFVPKSMRGRPDVITACVLYGNEIGVGPMQALNGIYVIDGRPFPSSELMRALIFREGHRMEVSKLDGSECVVTGYRRGEDKGTSIRWSLDMAKAAGLTSKNTWRNYPRQMLLARATMELARVAFPDVIRGLSYDADAVEVAEDWSPWANAAGTPNGTPEPPATKRIVRKQRRRDDDPPQNDGYVPAGAKAVRSMPKPPTNPNQPAPWIEDVPLPDVPSIPTPDEIGPPPDPFGQSSGAETSPPRPAPGGDTLEGMRRPLDAPLDPWTPPPGVGQPPLPEMPAEPHRPPAPGTGPDVGGALPVPDEYAPPVGSGVMRALHAAFHDINCDDRDLRLRITAAIIGRRIESSNDLTRPEALTTCRVLEDLRTGRSEMTIDSAGNVSIFATNEPEE